MSVRKDEAQLIITIDAKESVAYQNSVAEAGKLNKALKTAKIGTDEYNKALTDTKKISDELAKTDYTKLSLKNLQDRRKQLIALQQQLPQNVFAEQGFATELRSVNNAMRDAVGSTRALAEKGGGFLSSFKSKVLEVASGFALFEIAKETFQTLISFGKDSLTAYDEAAKAEAQLEAAILSTNGAAGKRVEDLLAQSAVLQKLTLFSDDQVQEAQGLLLTFTQVKGSIYDEAIPAILDMSTALGTDLSSASVQVGKALNDPIKGVAALGRAGVQFTAEQKEMITTMVEAGNVTGAQTIILKELETQFGGSAEAAAKAGRGPYQQFLNRIDDIKEGVGELINNGLNLMAPALDFVAGFLEKAVAAGFSFVKVIAAIPQFIRDNEATIKILIGSLILFNGQMILATANSLRLAAAENGRAIVTGAVASAQRLLNAAMTANPIGLVVKAVALLIGGLTLLYNKSETVRAGISGLGNVASEIFTIVKEAVVSFVDGFKKIGDGDFKGALSSFGDAIKKGNPVGIALTQGKRLKEAFYKGYNDKKAAEAAQKQAAKEAADLAKAGENIAKKSFVTGVDSPDGDEGVKKDKEKANKKAKEEIIDQTKLLQEKLEVSKKFADKLTSIEEERYLRGEISEQAFEDRKLEIKSGAVVAQLALLKALGLGESGLYQQKEVELLRIQKESNDKKLAASKKLSDDEKKLTDDQIKAVEAEKNKELLKVKKRLADGKISVEQAEKQKQQIIQDSFAKQLEILRNAGQEGTDLFIQIENERLDAFLANTNKMELSFQQRMKIFGEELGKEAYNVAGIILSGISDLESQNIENDKNEKLSALEEEYDKKFELAEGNAELEKKLKKEYEEEKRKIDKDAFEKNKQNRINSALANAALAIIQSLANTTLPFPASLIAPGIIGLQTGFQIAKIRNEKFERGGGLRLGKRFVGPSHASGGVKLPWGDEVEGDEIIINARSSRKFAKQLDAINSYNGWGRRLFALGGSINPDVTPSAIRDVPLNNTSGGSAGIDAAMIARFEQAVNLFASALPMLMNIKAHVVFSEIKAADQAMTDVENAARF